MGLVLRLITGLGDAAFLLPASAVLLGYLALERSGRAAVTWVSALALCAALTILAKIGFNACGAQLPTLDIRSPSGHASFSTTFYSCSALLLSVDKDRWARFAAISASTIVVVAIASSRVFLHAHTPEEVAVGLIIGLCCVGWFALVYLQRAGRPLPWQPVVAAIFALAVITHGRHLGVEGIIARLANQLHLARYACQPFTG